MIGFDLLLEGLVVLDLAWRDLRLAQGRAAGAELEAFAVHVVAVDNRIGHHGRPRIFHPGRELECRCGVEKLLRGAHGIGQQATECEQKQCPALNQRTR